MQTAEIIKDLGINYLHETGTMPRKYYLLNNQIDIMQKELRLKLNNKRDKKKFDKLIDTLMEVGTFESDGQFVSGFVLATHIMAEALTYKF